VESKSGIKASWFTEARAPVRLPQTKYRRSTLWGAHVAALVFSGGAAMEPPEKPALLL